MPCIIIRSHSFLRFNKSYAELLMELMELFNMIFCSWYPPLRDVVRNIDSNLAVEAKKQAIRACTSGIASAVVVGELGERK